MTAHLPLFASAAAEPQPAAAGATRIAFSLDRRLGLSIGELGSLAARALELGYAGLWTTGGTYDPFQLCAAWGRLPSPGASAANVGIAVIPVTAWPSAVQLATAAATTAELTGGRFILGLGVGHPAADDRSRAAEARPVPLARDYVAALRPLLAGETVHHEGPNLRVLDESIGWRPPRVPLYLAALGPAMLALAGQAGDGALLNWCTAEHARWSRAEIARAATAAGRRPEDVQVATQIRVALGPDEAACRAAVARQLVTMTLRKPREAADRGYQGHARRLGLGDLIDRLGAEQDRGLSTEALADQVPEDVVRGLAYVGPPDGAAEGVGALAGGCDLAIVRCVAPRPSLATVLQTLEACAPSPATRAPVPSAVPAGA